MGYRPGRYLSKRELVERSSVMDGTFCEMRQDQREFDCEVIHAEAWNGVGCRWEVCLVCFVFDIEKRSHERLFQVHVA
jgi:hypothetical protein